MPSVHADAELIRACIEGEAWAWNTLVERYQRLVYSIPLRAGLAQEDAEDVFQTVFTLLLEHLKGIRDAQGLGKWLITTAKRESWSVSRKRSREPNEDELATRMATEETLYDVRDEEASWMDQALMRDGFEQLGARCKALLQLLYYDPSEPSYEEISRRLGVPVGSIGPNRARCLARLKSILKDMGLH